MSKETKKYIDQPETERSCPAPTGSGIPICMDGEYVGNLPEGAKIDALVCVNGDFVMGTVKNINGNAVAIHRQNSPVLTRSEAES